MQEFFTRLIRRCADFAEVGLAWRAERREGVNFPLPSCADTSQTSVKSARSLLSQAKDFHNRLIC